MGKCGQPIQSGTALEVKEHESESVGWVGDGERQAPALQQHRFAGTRGACHNGMRPFAVDIHAERPPAGIYAKSRPQPRGMRCDAPSMTDCAHGSLVIAESEDRHEVPITRCGHAGNTIHVVVMRLACAIRFV